MRKGVSRETLKSVLILIALLMFLALIFSYFIGEGGMVREWVDGLLSIFKVVR